MTSTAGRVTSTLNTPDAINSVRKLRNLQTQVQPDGIVIPRPSVDKATNTYHGRKVYRPIMKIDEITLTNVKLT